MRVIAQPAGRARDAVRPEPGPAVMTSECGHELPEGWAFTICPSCLKVAGNDAIVVNIEPAAPVAPRRRKRRSS